MTRSAEQHAVIAVDRDPAVLIGDPVLDRLPQVRLQRAFVARRTGMALSDLQCRRLDEKLTARPGGLSPQYLMHLQSPAGAADLAELIDAISVQKTELFRDEPQLEALRTHVLGPMVARMRRPLRLWSAGCATGEEAYSLVIALREYLADRIRRGLQGGVRLSVGAARAFRFYWEGMNPRP